MQMGTPVAVQAVGEVLSFKYSLRVNATHEPVFACLSQVTGVGPLTYLTKAQIVRW